RWPWLVLMLLGTFMAWLVADPQRRLPARFEAEASARGWLVDGGATEQGFFSLVRMDVRLSLKGVAGVRASVDRIEIEKLPFSAPHVSLGHVHAELRGEPAMLLDAILAALPAGASGLSPTRLDLDYQHPRLGAVRFDDVKIASMGTGFVLRARRAEAAGHAFDNVVLTVERRNAMLLVAAGESPAQSRLQLSCFSPQQGVSRWLLSVLHQELRPLANALGWNLSGDFDAARIAGALTLELPEAASAPVEGRVSLVFDRFPLAAPPEAEPLLGETLSFQSNIVFDQALAFGQLSRLEIKTPVYSLAGSGRVEMAPTLHLEAQGERTCRELAALLPPSDARERVKMCLGAQPDKPCRDDAKARTHLGLWLEASGQRGEGRPAKWRFEPGCRLPPWSAPKPAF
ncbi:MAG TPA: hypothetical protein VF550_03320, partial [Polyangia bacterium]